MTLWRIFAHAVILIICLEQLAFGQQGPDDEDLYLFWDEKPHGIPDPLFMSHFRVPQPLSGITRMGSVLLTDDLFDAMAPSLATALYGQPGYYPSPKGGGRIDPNIRGLGPKRVALVVDGVPISSPMLDVATGFLSTLDPFDADKIEIANGPGSVQYGSGAMGGVIQAFTSHRRGYKETFDVNGNFTGRFATANIERIGSLSGSSNIGETFGAKFRVSGQKTADLDVGGDDKPENGAKLRGYYGGTNLDFLLRDRIRLGAQVHHGQITDAQLTDPDDKITSIRRDFFAVRMITDHISPIMTWSETTVAYQQLAQSRDYRPSWLDNERVKDDFLNHAFSSLTTIQTEFHDIAKLIFGLDLTHHIASSENDLRGPIGSFTPLPDGAVAQTFGLFAESSIHLGKWLTLTPGVRFDQCNISADISDRMVDSERLRFSDSQPSAQFGLLFPITDHTFLIADGARGYRFPTIPELAGASETKYLRLPNPNLDSESIYNYELGYRLDFPYVKGSLFVYNSHVDELISDQPEQTPDNLENTVRCRNGDPSMITGAEVTIDMYLGINWKFGTNLAYTYGADKNGEPLPGIPPYFGAGHLRWTDDTGVMFIEGEILWGTGKGRYATEEKADREHIHAFASFNVTMGFNITNYIDVLLAAENISDVDYKMLGSEIHEPGTNFKAQLDMHF